MESNPTFRLELFAFENFYDFWILDYKKEMSLAYCSYNDLQSLKTHSFQNVLINHGAY